MQTDETRAREVIQADREAAMARDVSVGYTPRTRAKVLRGDKDEDALVQAFARHRLAFATPSAGRDGLGASPQPELIEIIRQWLMSTDHNVSDWERQFAVAIEAMMTASGWQRPTLPPAIEKAEK